MFIKNNFIQLTRILVDLAFIVIILNMALPGFHIFVSMYMEIEQQLKFLTSVLVYSFAFALVISLLFCYIFKKYWIQFANVVVCSLFVQFITVLAIWVDEWVYVWLVSSYLMVVVGLKLAAHYWIRSRTDMVASEGG